MGKATGGLVQPAFLRIEEAFTASFSDGKTAFILYFMISIF